MLTSPDLQLPIRPLENRLRYPRVMQQPQRVIPGISKPIEPALLNPHAQRNRPHYLHMQRLARLEEAQHIFLELGRRLVAARPHVRHLWLVVASNLQRLFQVGDRLAHLLLCAGFVQGNELLAALRDVAAIRGRGVPRHRILLFLRAGEERGALRKGVGNGRGGDAMVLEVYEAGILEAIEDGFGGGLFGGGVTGEELVEVNQLSNVSIAWKEVYISHTGMTRSSWATA